MIDVEGEGVHELDGLDENVKQALKVDMVVDITTTGRESGLPRLIEIWAHHVDGRVFIMGAPGRRSWYANLMAQPEFTFHLKQDVHADITATAQPVKQEAERRAIFTRVKEASAFGQRRDIDIESWVKGSCLVTVALRGA